MKRIRDIHRKTREKVMGLPSGNQILLVFSVAFFGAGIVYLLYGTIAASFGFSLFRVIAFFAASILLFLLSYALYSFAGRKALERYIYTMLFGFNAVFSDTRIGRDAYMIGTFVVMGLILIGAAPLIYSQQFSGGRITYNAFLLAVASLFSGILLIALSLAHFIILDRRERLRWAT